MVKPDSEMTLIEIQDMEVIAREIAVRLRVS